MPSPPPPPPQLATTPAVVIPSTSDVIATTTPWRMTPILAPPTMSVQAPGDPAEADSDSSEMPTTVPNAGRRSGSRSARGRAGAPLLLDRQQLGAVDEPLRPLFDAARAW